jgi:hypothetical protein
MANELIHLVAGSDDLAYYIDAGSSDFDIAECAVGYYKSTVDDIFSGLVKGAMRFRYINIARGTPIAYAAICFRVNYVSGDAIRSLIYGINEDNTNGFDINTWGRPKTSSYTEWYQGSPSGGTQGIIDVTSQVQAIINRSGWNSGNSMGFVFESHSSNIHDSRSNYVADTFHGNIDQDSYLVIRVNAEPEFKPTPITVAAPTFPSSRGYGLKISIPGVDVKTATDDQLLYTSDKDYMKILAEGQISTTANAQYLIAHGLVYPPRVLAFGRANGKSFELPRLFGGATDPVGSGLQGYVSVDGTNIRIITFINAQVYYYVFLDELI